MKLCSDECVLCCDFCRYCVHDEIDITPTGCSLYEDEEHQQVVENCGYCDDFYCFRRKEI